MAVGYTPGTQNSSEFEEELAAVSAQDEQAMRETMELEQMYAQGFNAKQNQERQQSGGAMARGREAIGDAAKHELKTAGKQFARSGAQVAKKVGTRAATTAASTIGGAISTALGGVSLPAVGIILGVFLAIVLVLVMIVSVLYYSCNSGGTEGFITKFIVSPGAKLLGYAPVDICQYMAVDLGASPTNPASLSQGEGEAIPPPAEDGAPANNLGDAAARDYLRSSLIGVNNLCRDQTKELTGQTCLGYTKQNTLNGVVNLKNACDAWAAANRRSRELPATHPTLGVSVPQEASYCNVFVTGASELGHATGPCSHTAGYKIDLRSASENLKAYILSISNRAGSRGGDAVYKHKTQNIEYVLESNHWDITFNCG